MAKKPRERKPEVVFTFVPTPQPQFTVGTYTLADGTVVTVNIVEWMGTIRKYIYWLSAKYRNLTGFTETELSSLGAVALKAAA